MIKINDQCKNCFHLQVCANVLKNQLFIREKMLKEENPKCEHYISTADIVEVKHGEWIDNHCTVCGKTPLGEELWEHLGFCPPNFAFCMDYCPCCNAKMDLKKVRYCTNDD